MDFRLKSESISQRSHEFELYEGFKRVVYQSASHQQAYS